MDGHFDLCWPVSLIELEKHIQVAYFDVCKKYCAQHWEGTFLRVVYIPDESKCSNVHQARLVNLVDCCFGLFLNFKLLNFHFHFKSSAISSHGQHDENKSDVGNW